MTANPLPHTNTRLQKHCTREALRIWRKYAATHPHAPGMGLMPLLLGNYPVGADILFVGMNPSYSRSAVQHIWAMAKNRKLDGVNPLAWEADLASDVLAQRVEDIQRFEAAAVQYYTRYFKPLKEFAAEAGTASHAHIDVFVARHTAQAELRAAYGERFAALTPVAKEQFKLFRTTLKAMAPKTVVIANAGASHLVRDGLGLTTKDRGRTYRWVELPGVPIFLTSMLSGQRALDVFSRARLAADVRLAL